MQGEYRWFSRYRAIIQEGSPVAKEAVRSPCNPNCEQLVERKRHAETETEGAFVIRRGLAFVSLRRSVLRQRALCVFNTMACPSLSSQAYEQYINNSASTYKF